MAEPLRKSSARDTFESLIVTVILAIFGTTFVVQAFKIPTGSMKNTLLIGDHLLVNKFCFADQPGWLRHILPYRQIHRGDILVFKFPYAEEQEEPGTHLVKRVIGVPGDRIRIVNRQVFVNGVAMKEPYVRNTFVGIPRSGDDFPEGPNVPEETTRWSASIGSHIQDGQLVVPPGKYFVMGDNRENSWDSRFWGFVPGDDASGRGRPILIYWSYKTAPDAYLQTSFVDRVSQTVSLIVHFFTKTRWRRTFRLVR